MTIIVSHDVRLFFLFNVHVHCPYNMDIVRVKLTIVHGQSMSMDNFPQNQQDPFFFI
jgi:hypothetical protein